jgi:hypothetical protein
MDVSMPGGKTPAKENGAISGAFGDRENCC